MESASNDRSSAKILQVISDPLETETFSTVLFLVGSALTLPDQVHELSGSASDKYKLANCIFPLG